VTTVNDTDLSNSDHLEGRFPVAGFFICDFSYFFYIGIAFCVAIVGEDRNFKFCSDCCL